MAAKKASAGKKGSSPNVYKYFKIEGDKLTRGRKNCSRCGKGVFMSKHKDRNTCGKCGLTEFNQ
jgi:ubiquitin-small subunit ribosomal protein S27Ae